MGGSHGPPWSSTSNVTIALFSSIQENPWDVKMCRVLKSWSSTVVSCYSQYIGEQGRASQLNSPELLASQPVLSH